MAIQMALATQAECVKLVSMMDDAIDWNKSMSDAVMTDDDEDIIAARKREYLENHDVTKLVYLPDSMPTVFVFRNPRLLENSKIISNIQLGVSGIGQKKNRYEASDLWFRTFDLMLIGTASNMMDDPIDAPRDRHTKLLDTRFVEAMAAQNIIAEMGSALLGLTRNKENLKKS